MKKYILLLILAVIAVNAWCANELYTTRVEGTSITSGSTYTVFDDKYSVMAADPTWPSQFFNRTVTNRVILGINPEILQTSDYTVGITMTIKSWTWDALNGVFTVGTVTNKTVSVNYFTLETNEITDLSTYVAAGAHRVDVTITAITGGASISNVFLQSEIEVERYYVFGGLAPTGISGVVSSNGKNIDFAWTPVAGAELYELEWVHINNYEADNLSLTIPDNELKYDFYKNSTRVIIRTPYYQIPRLLDKGRLVFRIRAIGLTGQDYKMRKEGTWSAAESGLVSTHPTSQVVPINSEYDAGMNWAHQVTYAEDGKRFEGVSFMDGMSRTRQSVGKNTATEQSIVGNLYLDGYGRPVISSLPTPVDGGFLEFTANFNKVDGGTAFGASNIDQTMISNSPTCSFEIPGFSTTTGAGKYYSPSNPDQEGENARIPDAQKFPFTKVEYKDDFTGRAERVGAYGPDFKIGSGHTTYMSYVTPSQEELDRLFGSEAGYADHYQQRFTIDANGQAYIEYFDMAGRLVASGMAGGSPSSLDDIDPNVLSNFTRTITEGENGAVTPVSMNYTTTLMVTTQANYVFNYNLNPEQFTSTCMAPNLCFDCAYTLTIRIKDADCGTVVRQEVIHINGAQYDAICNGTYPYVMPTITQALSPKLYIIEKELSVDQDAIDAYWCKYIEDNSCVDSYSEIFNKLYSNGDFDNCSPVFSDPNDPTTDCEASRYLMMQQLSPDGQYGLYTVSGSGVYSSTDPISIYNESNTALGGYDWRTPSGDYKNADGSIALVEVTLVSTGVYSPAILPGASTLAGPLANGNYTVHPEQLATLTDFIERFDDSWAEALLPYHPEYCYLQFCEANTTSHTYDADMVQIATYGEACSGGYFSPLGTTIPGSVPLFTSCNTTSAIDPFFASGGGGATLNSAMQYAMSHYLSDGTGTATIWDVAIASVSCPQLTFASDMVNCARNYDGCYDDAIWLQFLALYLELKEKYYYQAEDAKPACDNAVIGNGAGGNPFANAQKVWGQYTDAVNGAVTTTPNADLDGIIRNVCQDACEHYADEWMLTLASCPDYATLSNADRISMRLDFIALCSYGCDQDHPQGATTLPDPASLLLPGSNVTITNGAGINAILAIYYPGFTEGSSCTELLISEPQPYEADKTLPFSYLDNCGCDLLMQTRLEFNNLSGNLPAGVVTIEDYLAYSRGLSLADIDAMLCDCDKALDDTWYPGYEWSSQQITTIRNFQDETVPQLTCSSCVDCDAVATQLSKLKDRLGKYVADSPDYPVILTNYLNNAFDFHLGYTYYEAFLLHCSGTEENPICEPTDELTSWFGVTNLIVHQGQLITPQPNALDMLKNVVYKNSDLQAALQAKRYWSEVDHNVLTIHYTDGETEISCTTTLTLAEDAVFSFDDIAYFDNIDIISGSCSGPNDEFTVNLHYIACGQLVSGQLSGKTDCFPVQQCYCGADLQLCDLSAAEQLADNTPCYEPLLSQLYQQTNELYAQAISDAYTEFARNYNDKCNNAFASELLKVTGPLDVYQYTLFYYDQAGNLIKTVAPKGVDEQTTAEIAAAVLSRETTTDIDHQQTPVLPTHTYTTEYVYNSYDQLVSTTNPDQQGATDYFYDVYGRIVLSRNPLQLDNSLFSYTIYDRPGRPVEVGQVVMATVPSDAILKAEDRGISLQNLLYSKARKEVTYTKYDESLSGVPALFAGGVQQNLRLRVASVVYFENIAATTTTMPSTGYVSAIHYSYDLHGNVLESVQDVPKMSLAQQQYKSTQYEFELISGNVKKVKYQAGKSDQHIHRYKYDQLNRLTETFTSIDDVTWQRDVHYRYFDYGPLARIETGEYKVQGSDYAYTINGWIKGVNSNTLTPSRDGGSDGTTGYSIANPGVNSLVARDVYGYTLGYYQGDYKSIATTGFEAAVFGTANSLSLDITPLYNGNIAYSTIAIQGFTDIQASSYHYDQLQRLKSMKVFRSTNLVTNNNWFGSVGTPEYGSAYSYDENGNLTRLVRKGTVAGGIDMDDLSYVYHTGNWNRLARVTDANTSVTAYDDIKTMASTNYTYDKLGQLITDVQENITNISWRFGDKKIRYTTTETGLDDIEYVYNPFGQRVMKIIKPKTGTTVKAESFWKYYYYAYDADGEVMATYEVAYGTYNTAKLNEQMIYGQSRLGYRDLNKLIYTTQFALPVQGDIYNNTLGNKRYELTNHLGNVVAVLSDRKMVTTGGTPSTYQAVILMRSDYYPFGMTMPDRFYQAAGADAYRFGYNGMEQDPEMKGQGNSYTTEFRQYDPRLGRWMSLDPLMSMFPNMSPYVAFNNNPVLYTDPYGLSAVNEGGPPEMTGSESPGEISEDGLWQVNRADDGTLYWANLLEEVIVSAAGPCLTELYDKVVAITNNYIENTDRFYQFSFTGQYEQDIFIQYYNAIGEYMHCKGIAITMEDLHTVLDILGMVPVAGEFFDAVNALLYVSEGDYVNAGTSAAGLIPIGGQIATGSRLAKKLAVELVEEVESKAVRDLEQNMIEKVDRSLLDPPMKDGKAPTFKSDGSPVEIHHVDQNPNGPYKEMHWEDHRGGANYKKNHPSGQKPLTKSERKQFDKERRAYWKKQYPKKG